MRYVSELSNPIAGKKYVVTIPELHMYDEVFVGDAVGYGYELRDGTTHFHVGVCTHPNFVTYIGGHTKYADGRSYLMWLKEVIINGVRYVKNELFERSSNIIKNAKLEGELSIMLFWETSYVLDVFKVTERTVWGNAMTSPTTGNRIFASFDPDTLSVTVEFPNNPHPWGTPLFLVLDESAGGDFGRKVIKTLNDIYNYNWNDDGFYREYKRGKYIVERSYVLYKAERKEKRKLERIVLGSTKSRNG